MELWLGLRADADGIRLRPMNDGLPFAVRGLSLRGATLDIELHGSGAAVASATLDGNPLPDPAFVPFSALLAGRRHALRIDLG